MIFDRIADQKIRDAMAEGAFDDLPGSGDPIDLEAYFRIPEHLRMALSVLKSAGCPPAEVELINEIAELDRKIADTTDERARGSLQAAAADRRLKLALALEQLRRR
jgi:hypothetical protein